MEFLQEGDLFNVVLGMPLAEKEEKQPFLRQQVQKNCLTVHHETSLSVPFTWLSHFIDVKM